MASTSSLFPPGTVSDSSIQFSDSDVASYSEDYERTLAEAEDLCNVADPESTPYVSKYKARDMLYGLSQKFEAYSVVARASMPTDGASRSKKKEEIEDMLAKVASLRVRSGIISYDCDEPHNAERDLVHAGDILFPGFYDSVQQSLGPDADDVIETDPMNAPEPTFDPSWYPPEVVLSRRRDCVHGMRCLNMMGILWAGRAQVKKSFVYLHAAKNLYHDVMSWLAATSPKASSMATGEHDESFSLTAKQQEELESLFTHNLFYLAQAFGHISNMQMSSRYCHETLRRQLLAGFDGPRTAFGWVKNCAGMSNFYQTMELYQRCRLALHAADKVLNDHVITYLNNEKPENQDAAYRQLKGDTLELEADIHRRLAHLDLMILKKAFEREVAVRDYSDVNGASSSLDLSEFNDADVKEAQYEDYNDKMHRKTTAPSSISTAESETEAGADELSLQSIALTLPDESSDSSSSGAAAEPLKVAALHEVLFPHLQLESVAGIAPRYITTFEHAKEYYLRSIAHIEAAKRYFQLDGYVTDHYNLLADQSRLFHYLAFFESDVKRKLAMETKRIELLQHLLSQLSLTAFEVLHKQISFELGETYMALLELKLEKFRGKSSDGTIHMQDLKKAEILKINSYCKGALVMFCYFTALYAGSSNPLRPKSFPSNFETMSFQQILDIACFAPDESLISDEELRPFLNAHFFSCRMLQRVVCVPNKGSENGAMFLASCLKRYEWIVTFTGKIRGKRESIDVDELFGAEINICQSMAQLLPSKIDRMVRFGEGGLSDVIG